VVERLPEVVGQEGVQDRVDAAEIETAGSELPDFSWYVTPKPDEITR
jgi:hypothetical protein